MAVSDKRRPQPIENPASATDTTNAGVRLLELGQIRCYDRNPRHTKNPEYDRIKASILTSGLDQPLVVTQRPSDPHFIVQAGGNTRLQILKELYATTSDERFSRVPCRYREWQRESAVLLAHLRENDLRGDLIFIDKARGVLDLKALIAEERCVAEVSHRQLASVLKEQGYHISHLTISLMDYAVSVLLPAMPVALAAGLARAQVQRIRALDRVAGGIWCQRGIGRASEYQQAFQALCRRYDAVDWQLGPLRQALENELAEAAELGIQAMRMEFDCRLSGHEPDRPDSMQEDYPVDPANGTLAVPPETSVADADSESDGYLGAAPTCGESGEPRSHAERHACGREDRGLQLVVELPAAAAVSEDDEAADDPANTSISVERLRKKAFALAQRLAGRQGFGDLVAPLADGAGFVVCNELMPAHTARLDHERRPRLSTLWWQLVALAEMKSAPATAVADLLYPESELSRAVSTGDWSAVGGCVSILEPADLGARFWGALSDEDWQDWLSLAQCYRHMRRLLTNGTGSLWERRPC